MRIASITNFFPPHSIGGQEKSFQEINEGLAARGHQIKVLTSMHGVGNRPRYVDNAHRGFYLEMELAPLRPSFDFFVNRQRRERHNVVWLQNELFLFKPDVILVGGMWNIPRSVPIFLEKRYPDRVVYRFADYWPALPSQYENYWRAEGRFWYTRLPKKILARHAIKILQANSRKQDIGFDHVFCVSKATRDNLVKKGIPVSHARIIYSGLRTELFFEGNRSTLKPQTTGDQDFILLYAGRISKEKGVETLLDAVRILIREKKIPSLKLKIAGTGATDYLAYLEGYINQAKITDRISFLGNLPYEVMPEKLKEFDVLVVPSIWPEPFARITLEGMISGLVVVATSIGGTPEVIDHKRNGLLFAPGDARDLSEQISTLAQDHDFCNRLAQAGKKTVEDRFTFKLMIDKVEEFLASILREKKYIVKQAQHSYRARPS